MSVFKMKIAFVVIALGAMLVSVPSIAQSLATDLAGAWALVRAEGFGQSPLGVFMFDGKGHFSALLMRSDIPKYASGIRTKGSADEYKATVEGSNAFFGNYALSGNDLNLHIIGSTFPNWIGTDQKRLNLIIKGDELTFTQPSPSQGGAKQEITWKKMK